MKKRKKKWFRALVRQRFFIILLLFLQLAFIIYLLVDQSRASIIIKYLLHIISFFVALSIIAQRNKGAYKLTWVFTILIFPVFGGLFYLLFRYQTRSKKLRKWMNTIVETAKPAFLLPGDKYEKALELAPEHGRQIEYLDRFSGFPVCENTKTTYLSSGETFFQALLTELEKAQKYIFLEYYIVEGGVMWDAILAILQRKVLEGVEVRLIYDDVGCFLRLPKDYAKTLKNKGIDCVVFNKFRPLLNATQNNRDHRKIIVIDGKVAFTGGINLADEYINEIHPYGHWKDAGIKLEGEAAWSMTMIFLQMWIYTGKKEDDLTVYYPWKDTPCPIVKNDSLVQPYADAPFDEENVSEHVYLQIITRAKRYLYISTPYLIVDDSMISAITLAAKSGVDVRIITPYRWDKRVVHFTTRSYYRELIKAGVKIYEYTPGFIHSKTFVSDDTVATIGTANMDFRSLYLQFECGTWLYKSEAVTELRDDFLKTLESCHQIAFEECRCNAFSRFLQDICRLFAPMM